MNIYKLFWVLLSPLIFILPTGHLGAFPKTDADFALLPPYCKIRAEGPNSAGAQSWKRRMGKGWTHVHHYCSGLDYLNKAIVARNQEKRIMLLNKALRGFSYMQENAPRKFILQPEISTQKGRTYLKLNRDGAALQEFHNAIKLSPKYVPAYSALSDYYRDKNQTEEARKILELGLKHNPKSKSLKRRLDKL